MKSNRIAALLRVPNQSRLQDDLLRVKRLIETKLPLYQEQRLLPGRPVRIIAGPLMGLTGVIESRPGPCRFIVAVDFIGQGVSVQVDARSIEPLEGEADPPRGDRRHSTRIVTRVQ
jgi:transcription antitermination factor NusG